MSSSTSTSKLRVAEDDERRLKAFLATLCDANAYLDVIGSFDEHRERSEYLLNATLRARAFSSTTTHIVHVANRQSGLFPCGLCTLLQSSASIVSVCGRQSIVDVVAQVLEANRAVGHAAPVNIVQSRILSLEQLNDVLATAPSAPTPTLVVLDLFASLGLGDGALRVATLLHERAQANPSLPPITIVPARMRLMAVAIDLSVQRRSIGGFDLSAFDAFKRAEAALGWISTPLSEHDYKLMSAPVELFDITFAAPPLLPRKNRHVDIAVTQCGTITGILCWYELADDSGDQYASFDPRVAAPPSRNQCVFGLREPLRVSSAHGATITIEASLSSTMLFVNATVGTGAGVTAVTLPRHTPPVQSWHWVMLGDAHRNFTYEAALRRAIQMREPAQRLVLDVGGGTGLLSMMAARAGADRVVCVESSPHVAQQARDIVATNGFADSVSVVAMHSAALQVGASSGLPRPADILVTEIFDYQLLGEQCLATIADCHARGLVAPNATVIPRGATVFAQLVELDRFGSVPVRFADGTAQRFDLSALQVFLENNIEPSWDGIRLEHQRNAKLLSDVFIPFTFDFTAAGAAKLTEPRDVVMRVPIRRSGSFNAVVYFYHLQMDGEARLSTAPGASRAWCQALQHMSTPIDVEAGKSFDIACLHDASRFVFVDAEQRSGPPGGPVSGTVPKWFTRLKNRERLARQLGTDELGIMPRSRPPAAVLAQLRSLAARATDVGLDAEVCTRVLTNVLTWSA